MNHPLLVLDCHYLCHRAFHSQKDLSFEGIKTGVIYGFLAAIGALKNQFQTDRIAFCFEGATLWRRIYFPAYKQKRIQYEEKADPVKLKARGDLCRQIDELRLRHLPRIGFGNIFYFPGHESDDIMAEMARKQEGEVILVTSDADMYQCLSPRVSMFSPQQKKFFTDEWFRKEYGTFPKNWALVKAMAGCATDGVPGIPGVGEETALKFIKGELPRHHKIYEVIKSAEAKEIVSRNRRLVELPFSDPGVPEIKIEDDVISQKGWNEVCLKLGIRSMVGRAPVYSRKCLKLDA